jgi:glycosyltransferase involved in cell wall biosynthesis
MLSSSAMQSLHEPGHVARKAAMVARGFVQRLGDVLAARRFDAVYVYRELFPLGYPLFERVLAARGIPYIMDFDDAIWLQNSTAANRLVAPLKFAAKTATIARHASLVTVGNEYLADWARQFQDNVRVIPTTIDTDLYEPEAKPGVLSDDPVCIGWSGSKTTIAHLRTMEDVLVDVQRSRGVQLRVIGDAEYRLPGAVVDALPWRETTELEDLAPIDIGIMPLPDDEWARGKCGLKALQYMALGIPTVMSPVGVNVEIADGGAALLASSKEEWRGSLERLVDDVELRADLGRAGRIRVVERYSVEANKQAYLDAARSLAVRPPGPT